jgi:hypothetical protein
MSREQLPLPCEGISPAPVAVVPARGAVAVAVRAALERDGLVEARTLARSSGMRPRAVQRALTAETDRGAARRIARGLYAHPSLGVLLTAAIAEWRAGRSEAA